ncbi:MAG: hypothetical protein ACTHK8_19060 [Ginsengibacter sp.]
MKGAAELVQAFKTITAKDAAIFPAVVVSVDKINSVCDVSFSDLELGNVRLQALIKADQKGLKIFPVVDSNVLVGRIGDEGEMCVLMYSEIESVSVAVDNTTLEIKDGFLIQRDADTLKDALVTLIEAVEKIVVMEGTNPDYLKLTDAKTKIENILR